jgi:hypothetical protein
MRILLRRAAKYIAGIVQEVDLSRCVLSVTRVELDDTLDGAKGGNVHEERVGDNIERDTLGTGWSG